MSLAIFGINNDFVNLAVSLLVLMFVVVWFALIVYTYMDAKRRIDDPVLVACATAAALFPYIGTAVYSILRPPDFLDDVRERELEIKAAELRVRQLAELSCENCGFPVEKNYLRCPNCQRRLKDPCNSCGKPVDPRWALCPYCESALPGRGSKPPAPEQPRKREEGKRRGDQRRDRAAAGSSDSTGERQEGKGDRAARKEAEAREERESRRGKREAAESAESGSEDGRSNRGRRAARRAAATKKPAGRSGDSDD
jgi:double zinc ribbon protein